MKVTDIIGEENTMTKNTKKTVKKMTKKPATKQSGRRPNPGQGAEDGIMDVVKFGAKAVIGAGVIGALGNTMQGFNK